MERMFADKIRVHLNGNIFSGGQTYAGIVEYASENGLEYFITTSIMASKEFAPEKIIYVDVQIPSGSMLNLTCDVLWFVRPEKENNTVIFEMKILDPPPLYTKYMNNLLWNRVPCSFPDSLSSYPLKYCAS